jgi:hypothetical protein
MEFNDSEVNEIPKKELKMIIRMINEKSLGINAGMNFKRIKTYR